jgi:type IV secretory pathway TrbD component
VVAYALVSPAAHSHDTHRYLDQLPLLGGAAFAVVVGAGLRHALRGRAGTRPSPWLFAVLPPFAFALQEHLERLAAPALVLGEPTFVLGLALQIPFGLLAWLLARAILRAADALGALLDARPRLRSSNEPRPAASFLFVLRPAVAACVSQRGPPLVVATRS